MKKNILSKNISKKRNFTTYVRKSQRRKMLRARDAKRNGVLACLQPLFRNKAFFFPKQPTDPSSFLASFCKRYIFSDIWRENKIPSPYCSHLFISSSLIWALLHNKSMLPLMHGYYYTEKKRNNARFSEYYYHNTNLNVRRAPTKRSQILPFVVANPDFVEGGLTEEERVKLAMVEVKHSRRKKDLQRLRYGKNTQAEIQLRTAMSVFGYRYGKLALIYRRPHPQNTFDTYYVREYIDLPDFLEEHYLIIATKYFQKVLLKYIQNEFGLNKTHLDFSKEEKKFIKEVERWKKPTRRKHNTEVLRKGEKIRKHWKSACIKRYQKEFKRVSTY